MDCIVIEYKLEQESKLEYQLEIQLESTSDESIK